MTPSGGAALFELVVGLSAPSTGVAEVAPPIPIRIVFEAPANCSSERAFQQGVRTRTERVRLAEPGERAMELHVQLSQSSGGAHGELRMHGEHGETDTRRVDGGTCDEIVEALSLTAALAIDPAARVSPEPPEPPPPPPPPKPPVEPPPPPPAPVEDESTTLRLELGAKLLLTEIVSPFTSVGGELSAHVRFSGESSAGPSIGIAFVRVQNDFFGEPEKASIRFTAATLTLCPARWTVNDVITLEPCAHATGGWLGATGKDLSYTRAVLRPVYGAGGSLSVGVPIGAVAIEVSGAFTLPWVTRRFVVGEPARPRRLGETPAVVPFVGLGLRYGF